MSRSLTSLYVSDNYFEGTIPTHLCEFSGLEALFLDTNKFSGSIPDCFGGMTEMKQLYLFGNQLTGTVPASLQNLKQLGKFGIRNHFLGNSLFLADAFSLIPFIVLKHFSWLWYRT